MRDGGAKLHNALQPARPPLESDMPRTIEATISQNGTIRLSEPVKLPGPRRALVTILEEQPVDEAAAEDQLIGEAGAEMAGQVLESEDFSDWPSYPANGKRESNGQ